MSKLEEHVETCKDEAGSNWKVKGVKGSLVLDDQLIPLSIKRLFRCKR
jgi:hypothetical protein